MLMTLKIWITALISFLVLDFIWLGFVANRFYIEGLGPWARMSDGKLKPVLWAAAIVYVVLASGVTFFSLPKVAGGEPLWVGLLWGGFFGLILYGCYDMTNYSTLKDWPLTLSWMDIAWGAVICGLATMAAQFVRDL